MADKAEVFIPFCGFYESWVDGLIDDEIEQQAEHYEVDEITPENYKVNFKAIAEAYVDLYEATLFETMREEGAEPEHAPKFTFKELISPQFYNFETDRILVEVDSIDNLMEARLALYGDGTLQRDIDEMFRSRSGFISFYNDFADNWQNKPLDEWDYNELSVLLPDFDMEDFADPELTTFREAVMAAVEVTSPESDPAPTA